VTDQAPGEGQGEVFGAAAAEYERGRPSYPREAVDWLLPDGATRVLDLGAGTGKLTRRLSEAGLDVVAVEPSAGMREQLHRVLPEVDTRAGRAEAIPLDDGTVDAVLVAQAWHWVTVDRAVPEVARVLRPGGRLGLVWNVRDEREEWVNRLGQILADSHEPDHPDLSTIDPQVGPPFGPLERRDIAWTHPTTPDGLLDLVASRSYVITLPDADRAALLHQVRDLLTGHPALAGRQRLGLPYVTRCFRATLPS
jgi:SAM-dependent methyltransferase